MRPGGRLVRSSGRVLELRGGGPATPGRPPVRTRLAAATPVHPPSKARHGRTPGVAVLAIALKSGLIDEAQLRACWELIPEEKRTPDAIDRRLARQAITAGRLTLWQAQQILAGRATGFRIDKYVLLDLLGQGGMGRVYLARDTRLNRRVALKILSQERMNNPRAIARFQREAKVGAQLQHENLVRIYDEGESAGSATS